jgi:hypothetical protein
LSALAAALLATTIVDAEAGKVYADAFSQTAIDVVPTEG